MDDTNTLNRFDFPISVFYDTAAGKFEPYEKLVERRISDLAPMYHDQNAVTSMIESGDPLIYEIFYYSFPASKSDWGIGVSRIKPGKVGDERQ